MAVNSTKLSGTTSHEGQCLLGLSRYMGPLEAEVHEQMSRSVEQLNVDQSTVSRRLKIMGKIIKVGRWRPHELTDRQQENPKLVCKMLLARYKCKSYLHRIVTGDEKWIYFENPKHNRSYVDPGQPSKSAARQCCAFSGIKRDQLY
ncbi:mariner Mos1 transposase [Trichonephila clavipes]|nr:mariner Mos1 transposase [Trichonephila clavipes]